MNICHDWKDRLLKCALDALRDSEKDELEKHLQGCAACSAGLDSLRVRQAQMDAGLRQLVQHEGPSPEFGARVLTAVESAPARPSMSFVRTAALATGVVLLAMVSPGSRILPPERTPVTITALSRWQSPSAQLLRPPAGGLLQPDLRLGKFYFSLESLQNAGKEETDKGGNHED